MAALARYRAEVGGVYVGWIGNRLGWESAQDRIGSGPVATGPEQDRDGLRVLGSS